MIQYFEKTGSLDRELSSSKRQNRDMGAISKMDFIGQNRYLEAMSVESRKTVRRQTKRIC